MAEVKLHAGATIDVLTKGELDRSLTDAMGMWRSYAYGLKSMALPVMRGTPSSGALTLGSTGAAEQPYCGPRQGYSWRITRVSVAGLVSGDTVLLYKGDPGDARFVDAITAPGPASAVTGAAWTSSHGLLLRPGDHLVVVGSGLTATKTVTVSGEAIEAPAEMVYKLIGG